MHTQLRTAYSTKLVTALSANSITSICCGFVVQQLFVQQIHGILTCRRTRDQHSKRGDASIQRVGALVVLITSTVVVQQVHNKLK